MPLPTRKKTYGSKKNESGIIDHKDIFLYTNDKSTLFDAYSIKNIKKYKRNNSYLAGPSDMPVSKKVTRKKVGKRLTKEMLVQTVQNNNFDVLATPKRIGPSQGDKGDPFDNLKTLQTSVVLTPDLSLHVKRLSVDPFDKLCNSRLEQPNQISFRNVDPRVNLSSDDESLTFNNRERHNVNKKDNDFVADMYNNISVSNAKDNKVSQESPVMATRRQIKRRKRKIINKFTPTGKNSTSECSKEFFNHKLKVENVPQKTNDTSLSLTRLLKNVPTHKNEKIFTRNCDKSNLIKSPHGSANLLFSSTPIVSSHMSRFRRSITNCSPVQIHNDEQEIIQNGSVKESETKASPPCLTKNPNPTIKTQYVLDKEYTTSPLVAVSPESVTIDKSNSKSKTQLQTSDIGTENGMASVKMTQEIFAAKSTSGNLVVSPILFESFTRSVSILCDEHFQWKSREESSINRSFDDNNILVPLEPVIKHNNHSAIEIIDNCSNFNDETRLNIENNPQKLITLCELPVDDSPLQNNNTESQIVNKTIETILNIDDTYIDYTSPVIRKQKRRSSQSKKIMMKLDDEKHCDMEYIQVNTKFQNNCTKSQNSNEQNTLSDNDSYSIELKFSRVEELRKDNAINQKELCFNIDKSNESFIKKHSKSHKLHDITNETTNSQLQNNRTKSQDSQLTNDFRYTHADDNSCTIALGKLQVSSVNRPRKLKSIENEDNNIIEKQLCRRVVVHIDKLNDSVVEKYIKSQNLNHDAEESNASSEYSCYSIKSELSKSFDYNSMQSVKNIDDSYELMKTKDKLNNENTNNSTISDNLLSEFRTKLDSSCSKQSLGVESIDLEKEINDTYKSIDDSFMCERLCVNIERLNGSVLRKYTKCQNFDNMNENNDSLLSQTSDVKYCMNNKVIDAQQKYKKSDDSENKTVRNYFIPDNSYVQDGTQYTNNRNCSPGMKYEDGQDETRKNKNGLFSPKVQVSRLRSIDISKYVNPSDTNFGVTEQSRIRDLISPTVENTNKFITNRKKSGTPNDSNLSLPTIQDDCDMINNQGLEPLENKTSTLESEGDKNDQDCTVKSINVSNASLHCDRTQNAENSYTTNDSTYNLSNATSNMSDTDSFSDTKSDSLTCSKLSRTDIENKNKCSKKINVKLPLPIERSTRSKATSKKSPEKSYPMNRIEDRDQLVDSSGSSLAYETFKPAPKSQIKHINNQALTRRASINLRTRRVICQNIVNNVTTKRKRIDKLDKICESKVQENTNQVSRMSVWEKNFDYAVDDEIKRISDMHLFKVPNVFKVPIQEDNIDHGNSCLSDRKSMVLLPGKKWKKSLSIVRHMNETSLEEIQAPPQSKTFRESWTSANNVQSPLKGRKYRESIETVMDLQSPIRAKKYRESLAKIMEYQSPQNHKKNMLSGIDLCSPLKDQESVENLLDSAIIDLRSQQPIEKYRNSKENVINSQDSMKGKKCRSSVVNVTDIQSTNGRKDRDNVTSIMNLRSPRSECRPSREISMDKQSLGNISGDSNNASSMMGLQSTLRESVATVVDMEAGGFLSETCNDTAINFSSLSISDDEASGVIEKSINTSHCDRITTPRDVVLQRCNQTNAIPFNQCYTDVDLKNCRKIGEGVYGEVFLYRAQDGGVRVMKVIPVAGDIKVNGEPQKTFEEILSEIVIAMELSALRTPLFDDCKENCNAGAEVERIDLSSSVENATDTFNKVLGVHCVIGAYPSRLLDLWDLYDETRGSENDSPAQLPEEQQYIVLELANAGQDLESYQFNNAEQALALFYQVAYALAVAEESSQFEHRDLHWGNVLIAPTDEKSVRFVLRGQEHSLPSCGVRATIIDYSLSRLSLGASVGEDAALYSDLAQDPGLFDAVGDYQFEIYRLMRDRNGNLWKDFEPYTNILWLHYTLDKMITALRYKRTTTKVHKHYIAKLKELKGQILNYNSCVEFVLEDGKH